MGYFMERMRPGSMLQKGLEPGKQDSMRGERDVKGEEY